MSPRWRRRILRARDRVLARMGWYPWWAVVCNWRVARGVRRRGTDSIHAERYAAVDRCKEFDQGDERWVWIRKIWLPIRP